MHTFSQAATVWPSHNDVVHINNHTVS